MVIGVVISIYYYFGWIREICFQEKPKFSDDDPVHDPWTKLSEIGLIKFSLLALTFASFLFGLWQGSFGNAF